jgi:hypothetical protein
LLVVLLQVVTAARAHRGWGQRTLDERAARVTVIATRIANDFVGHTTAAACEKAERSVAEVTMVQNRWHEMLDSVFRTLEADAMEAKITPAVAQPPPLKKRP